MMYVRIVEITAPTKLQLNIFLDYLRITHFPKNLEQGQTSAKVFRVNEVSAFVIAGFKDKKSADRIKIIFIKLKMRKKEKICIREPMFLNL